MSESRQKPNSNVKRNSALTIALAEHTRLGTASYLSADTKTKLTTNQPIYKAAFDDVFSKSNVDFNNSALLEIAAGKLRRGGARFIKVFVLAVDDEEFPVANLQLYHLDSNGNVPPMITYDQIQEVAANLISGEAARVAAGGTPMSMPAISKIITLNNTFLAARAAKNASESALTTAQATLNGLNAAADDTILFVWNEVESHFSNLAHPALRVQGRLWGIVYERKGSTKLVKGTLKDSVTGLEILDATVYFDNGNNEALSGADGYELSTTLMGIQKLIASHPLYLEFSVDVDLVEGENPVVDIVMVKIV